MFVDQQLTEHFALSEMTITTHTELQDQNRLLLPQQIGKLTQVARVIGEPIRAFLALPILVHSGYRCKPLNDAVGFERSEPAPSL